MSIASNLPNFGFRQLCAIGLLAVLCACQGGGGAEIDTGTVAGVPSPTPSSTPTSTPTLDPAKRVYGAEIYVSASGEDSQPGTIDKPFKTLEKAQEALRALVAKGVPSGGIVVWLRGGEYERASTLELGALDSGPDASKPVAWCGYPGEEIRILGGRKINASNFVKVASTSSVWGRLDASAKGNLLQIDLKPILGITASSTDADKLKAYGQQKPSDVTWLDTKLDAALELFVDRQPMQLGRWPDAGANDPVQSVTADSVTVFGSGSPSVAGTFTKTGVQDGVSVFKRDGLVDYAFQDANGQVVSEKLQYYLYRRTWDYNGGHYIAWFLATTSSGSPSKTAPTMRPWWFRYQADGGFGNFTSYAPSGASGTLSLDDPGNVRDGFARIASSPSTLQSETHFNYYGDRPARWTQAKDIWMHGYFQWLYYDQHRAGTLDAASRTFTLGKAPGFGIKAGQPWYAYNLLEEITQPGEWYLDRETGILYLWPPSGFSDTSDVMISMLETPLFTLNKASNVVLGHFTAEGTRKNLVSISGGNANLLSHILLRNTGGVAVDIGAGSDLSGTNHLVSHCRIQNTGLKGVYMKGGDRPSLTKGNLRVEDCEISNFGRVAFCYQPAVQIYGCGQIVRNNLLHDSHHAAILWDGNENVIEQNEITKVCQTTSDAGVIYADNDWGARGNIIRHNYIHDVDSTLGDWVHGIYLDDCLSGVTVEGNIVRNLVGNGIMAGGGRDHTMVNNIFVNCSRGLYGDARGVSWNKPTSPNKGDWSPLLKKLMKLNYQQEPWASRYPKCAAIPNDWAVVLSDGHWLRPEGCVFSRNLGWKNGAFTEGEVESQVIDAQGNVTQTIRALERYAEVLNNVENQDPLFVDEANGDLTLSPTSPALAIPGFQAIPFKQIGIRK